MPKGVGGRFLDEVRVVKILRGLVGHSVPAENGAGNAVAAVVVACAVEAEEVGVVFDRAALGHEYAAER